MTLGWAKVLIENTKTLSIKETRYQKKIFIMHTSDEGNTLFPFLKMGKNLEWSSQKRGYANGH